MRAVVILAACAIALGTGGCEDSDGGGPEPITKSGGSSVRATVGSAGANLELESGVKITIPRGALSEDTEIEIAEANTDSLRADPVEAGGLEAPITMKPHGQKFDRDLDIELPLSRESRELEVGNLRVLRLDDEDDRTFSQVEGELEKRSDSKGVTFKIKEFSVYMVAIGGGETMGVQVEAEPTLPEAGVSDTEPDAGGDTMFTPRTDAGTGGVSPGLGGVTFTDICAKIVTDCADGFGFTDQPDCEDRFPTFCTADVPGYLSCMTSCMDLVCTGMGEEGSFDGCETQCFGSFCEAV